MCRRWGALWQAAAAIDRLLDLFDAQPTLLSPSAPVAISTNAPKISFDNVPLSHGNLPVPNDATFTAQAGL